MYSIKEFIQILRDTGFRISLSEVIEAHKFLLLADTPNELRLGIRMIFVKSKQEQDLFDIIWYTYFDPLIDRSIDTDHVDMSHVDMDKSNSSNDVYNETQNPLNNSPIEIPSQFPMSSNFEPSSIGDPTIPLSSFSSKYKGVVRQILQGNDQNAAAIMLRYILASTYSISELRYKQKEIRKEVYHMLQAITPQFASQLLAQLDHGVQLQIQKQLRDPINIKRNPLRVQNITELPLLTLTPSPELSHALRVLGRKLATKHKRKRKIGNRRINLRQTIRVNIQRGGTLLELKKTTRRVTKPKLIILTDVSPSTIRATQLFLSIIWHAKEVFSSIKYYEFIGNCIDVTTEFRRAKNVNEGIEASLKRWKEEIGGKENSDYFTAAKQFQRQVSSHLNYQTTIIMLGDLRDWLGPWKEGIPLSAKILGAIRQKVNRIIVLNPEQKNLWDSGDSICKYCQEQGLEIYEITDLGKLINALMTIK